MKSMAWCRSLISVYTIMFSIISCATIYGSSMTIMEYDSQMQDIDSDIDSIASSYSTISNNSNNIDNTLTAILEQLQDSSNDTTSPFLKEILDSLYTNSSSSYWSSVWFLDDSNFASDNVVTTYNSYGANSSSSSDTSTSPDSTINNYAIQTSMYDSMYGKTTDDDYFNNIENVVNRHFQYYCNPVGDEATNIFGSCNNTLGTSQVYADINVATILGVDIIDTSMQFPQASGSGLNSKTYLEVIDDFLYNLTLRGRPLPDMNYLDKLSSGNRVIRFIQQLNSNNNSDSQKAYEHYYTKLAMPSAFSVKRNSWNEIIKMRLPLSNTTTNQSMLSIIKNEANSRFLNYNWYNTLLNNTSTTARSLQVEQLQMLAYRNYMLVVMYKQRERFIALRTIGAN